MLRRTYHRRLVWRALLLLASLTALLIVGVAACTKDDGMSSQRRWCHDRGGYIANTGWYEWRCVINNTPVYMPSPRN
jgi:hypothetical protein